MALAIWNATGSLPFQETMPGLQVAICHDDIEMARINDLNVPEIVWRRRQGHEPYVAYLDERPVAYGWVATREAHIGELNIHVTLREREVYLWDFATHPAWRGRGIYPRLLQAILLTKAEEVALFWIAYAPENLASASGIQRAGFKVVAEMSFLADNRVALAPITEVSEIAGAASIFGIEVTTDELSPCWCCRMQDSEAHDCGCNCAIENGCTCSGGCGTS